MSLMNIMCSIKLCNLSWKNLVCMLYVGIIVYVSMVMLDVFVDIVLMSLTCYHNYSQPAWGLFLEIRPTCKISWLTHSQHWACRRHHRRPAGAARQTALARPPAVRLGKRTFYGHLPGDCHTGTQSAILLGVMQRIVKRLWTVVTCEYQIGCTVHSNQDNTVSFFMLESVAYWAFFGTPWIDNNSK